MFSRFKQWRHRVLVVFVVFLLSIQFLDPPSLESKGNPSGKFGVPIAGKIADVPASMDSDTKQILYFTTYWRLNDFQFGSGSTPFQDYQCPVRNCRVQSLHALNQSAANLSDFDAVLFSVQAHDHFDLREHRASIDYWRSQHQRFVFFMMESQAFPIRNLQDMKGFFNWTMTFRWDSDIPRPYGWFLELGGQGAPHFYPHKPDHWIPYDDQKFRQSLPSRPKSFYDLARRPGKVAWIVSHCDTESRREDYVYELRKYIDVHEFGGKCQQWDSPTCDLPYSVTTVDNCTSHIKEHYKFYLAFENQFCNDYATEKFFQRMEHSVVITLGQANYSDIAPPHSSISVFDFETANDLATYLNELDQDDEGYLSYFWWKDHYTVRHPRSNNGFGNGFGPSMCHLCAKLHDGDEPPKIYDDMERWWRNPAVCGKKLLGLEARMRQDPTEARMRQIQTARNTHHIETFVRKFEQSANITRGVHRSHLRHHDRHGGV